MATSTETKTRVTRWLKCFQFRTIPFIQVIWLIYFRQRLKSVSIFRYIHKDGQREPEVEIMEYDGRLSQDDLAKLAANSERIEVSIVDKHLQFLALYKMFV